MAVLSIDRTIETHTDTVQDTADRRDTFHGSVKSAESSGFLWSSWLYGGANHWWSLGRAGEWFPLCLLHCHTILLDQFW